MAAVTQILINGVNYEARITDLQTQIKETKKTDKNVKGGTFTLPPRSRSGYQTIQFTFPYLAAAQRAVLRALYDTQASVQLDHAGTLDFPPGIYQPIDFAESRIKNLDLVLYNVIFTFAQDTAAANIKTLTPAARTDLAYTGVPQTLGF